MTMLLASRDSSSDNQYYIDDTHTPTSKSFNQPRDIFCFLNTLIKFPVMPRDFFPHVFSLSFARWILRLQDRSCRQQTRLHRLRIHPRKDRVHGRWPHEPGRVTRFWLNISKSTNPVILRPQQAVEDAVKRVCIQIPSELKNECLNLVDTYGPALVEIIVQYVWVYGFIKNESLTREWISLIRGVDPSTVCPRIGLCVGDDVTESLAQLPVQFQVSLRLDKFTFQLGKKSNYSLGWEEREGILHAVPLRHGHHFRHAPRPHRRSRNPKRFGLDLLQDASLHQVIQTAYCKYITWFKPPWIARFFNK